MIEIQPTSFLIQLSQELERRLIDGTAIADDIDEFIRAQMELGERTVLDTLSDPRD